MTMETARHVAARIWCDPEFKAKVMQPELCEKIAGMLHEYANDPKSDPTPPEEVKPIDESFCRHRDRI